MKKSIFIVTPDIILMDLKYSGIHPLIICTDSLKLFYLVDDSRTFLELDTVINWYKEENTFAIRKQKENYKKIIELLEKKKAKLLEQQKEINKNECLKTKNNNTIEERNV